MRQFVQEAVLAGHHAWCIPKQRTHWLCLSQSPNRYTLLDYPFASFQYRKYSIYIRSHTNMQKQSIPHRSMFVLLLYRFPWESQVAKYAWHPPTRSDFTRRIRSSRSSRNIRMCIRDHHHMQGTLCCWGVAIILDSHHHATSATTGQGQSQCNECNEYKRTKLNCNILNSSTVNSRDDFITFIIYKFDACCVKGEL